jgi:type 1 glutamine amidotransferase/HEAT repeat protein
MVIKAKLWLSAVLCLLLSVSFVQAKDVSDEEIAKMKAAMPAKAVVQPQKPRKLLVFNLCEGYRHESIPYGAKALEIMGQKTGAFEVVQSEDMSVFRPENLGQFDAICLNNTTQLKFSGNDELQRSLMDFVKSGKGIVGIHAAVDNFYDWPEAAAMMGGLFDGHPWGASDTVTIKIDEPDHPLCKAFNGKGFEVTDEIYQLKDPYCRDKLRVLLSIDTAKTDMNRQGIKRTDGDFAISWVRKFGNGRVFYCSLGHNFEIFWTPAILEHYLAGIQFALGDLNVNACSGSTVKLIEADLKQIVGYEYGQSRMPLTEITSLTRQSYDTPEVAEKIEQLFLEFLRSDAGWTSKQFVCEELSVIGTGKSVDTLSNMLNDPKTSDIALYALQRIQSDKVDAALRGMLPKTSGKTRVGIINTIGCRRDSQAVSELGDVIDNSNDAPAIEAAIAALGRIANEESAEVLSAARSKCSEELVPAALDAYLKCADRFAESGNKNKALAIYKDIYGSKQSSVIRMAAMTGMVLMDKNSGPDIIIDNLKGNDNKICSAAVRLINQVPGEKMTKALTAQLDSFSPFVQMQVVAALAARGDSAALPAVVKAANSDDREVRMAALQAIGKLADASSVAFLAERAANTNDADEKTWARSSLYALPGEDINDVISRQLGHVSSPAIKIELIQAVGQRVITGAVPALLKSAEGADANVRIAMQKNVRIIAEPSDLPALVETLTEARSDTERNEAEKTLVTVAGRAEPGKKTAAILAKFSGMTNVDNKCSLISVLGEIGDDGLDVIRDGLKDKEPQIQKSAIRAMSAWPNPAPLDDLLNVAETSGDDVQKVLALRGVVKLLAYDSERSTQQTSQLYEKAMNLATQPSEKKMVLGGLANMKDVASLQMATGYLHDQTLKQEAAAAVTKIAQATRKANPQKTKDALLKMAQAATDESARKEALLFIDNIDNYADYLVAWQLSGPYTSQGKKAKELFDIEFAPEKQNDNTAKWKPMRVANDAGKVGIVELFKEITDTNCVAYLRNKVWSDKDQVVRLELGSNDGIKVWLNGELVHSNNVLRPIKRAEDIVDVKLKQGSNTMLLKITRESGGFETCAHFRNLDSTSVEELKVRAE